MARPTKDGLNYFPLDVVFEDNIELIIDEFGMKGLGVLITLFQKIFHNGYYIEWSQDTTRQFSHEVRERKSFVSEVLKACVKRGVFDKGLYRKHQILTSKGIQEIFFEVASRRKTKKNYRYLLIPIPSKQFMQQKSGVFVDNNSTKESKVKESKLKDISSSSVIAQIPINEEEESDLLNLMGDEVYHRYLDKAAAYIRAGGEYKNLYQVMLNWYRQDYSL